MAGESTIVSYILNLFISKIKQIQHGLLREVKIPGPSVL